MLNPAHDLLERLHRIADARGQVLSSPTFIARRGYLGFLDDPPPRARLIDLLDELEGAGEILRSENGPMLDSWTFEPVPTLQITRRKRHRPKFPVATRREVYLRDGFACQDCGVSAVHLADGVPFVHVINEGWVPVEAYTGRRSVWVDDDRFLTLDHVDPYSSGGPEVVENLRTLCGPCNSRKGARV